MRTSGGTSAHLPESLGSAVKFKQITKACLSFLMVLCAWSNVRFLGTN